MKKQIEFLQGRINALKGKITNSITDEAKADIESKIASLQEVVDTLKKIEEEAAGAEDDKTEEMQAKMKEVMARISALENSLKCATETVENQLKKITNSKKFANAFFETVQNSTTAAEFREKWNKAAKGFISNGIDEDNLEDFLPEMVLREIRDQFVGKRHRLLELVDWTGLPTFKSMWESGNSMGNYYSLDDAAGDKIKTEQELEFEPIEIRPGLIYKYVRIDRELERASKDMNDVLIRYITKELLDRLLCTIEDYILSGNGPFIAPVLTATVGGELNALAYMQDIDGAVAIMSKAKYLAIRTTLLSLNNRVASYEDVLAYLGVEEIIFNDRVTITPTVGSTWDGIWYLRPQDYKLVGDRRPDQFEDFNLAYNKKEYLTEMYIGGGCVVPNNFITLETEPEPEP